MFVHPNGILYADDSDMPADRRGDVPELIFVASYFFEWHGLDTLLDSMDESDEDGRLHLVGTLPATAREQRRRTLACSFMISWPRRNWTLSSRSAG